MSRFKVNEDNKSPTIEIDDIANDEGKKMASFADLVEKTGNKSSLQKDIEKEIHEEKSAPAILVEETD